MIKAIFACAQIAITLQTKYLQPFDEGPSPTSRESQNSKLEAKAWH